jgi:hypothetical protein
MSEFMETELEKGLKPHKFSLKSPHKSRCWKRTARNFGKRGIELL